MFAFLAAIYFSNIVAAVFGQIGVGFALIFSTITCYYMYQFHHEATHGNISGKSNALDKFIGNFVGVIIDLHFASYSKVHLQHHEYTNTTKDSLDSQFSEGYKSIIRSIKTIYIKIILCLPAGMKIASKTLSREDKIKAYKMSKHKDMVKFNRITLLAAVISPLTPLGWSFLLLWYVPANLSIFLMQFFLDWLPHSVYGEDGFRYSDKYRNTKVLRWFGSSVIMANQNYHLIHHINPRIPFHKYKTAFNLMHDSLVANGAQIQHHLARARNSGNK